jgi:hypothetical protein
VDVDEHETFASLGVLPLPALSCCSDADLNRERYGNPEMLRTGVVIRRVPWRFVSARVTSWVRMSDRRRHFVSGTVLAGVVALVVSLLPAVTGAQSLGDMVRSAPSDPRAQFFEGNVVRSEQVGFAAAVQVGSPDNSDGNDAHVAGTVRPNTGPIQTGVGEELNVTITANAVIDAVVVKDVSGSSVYQDAAFLLPTLSPPQHYISPLNGGAKVPDIGHWFVCYHEAHRRRWARSRSARPCWP